MNRRMNSWIALFMVLVIVVGLCSISNKVLFASSSGDIATVEPTLETIIPEEHIQENTTPLETATADKEPTEEATLYTEPEGTSISIETEETTVPTTEIEETTAPTTEPAVIYTVNYKVEPEEGGTVDLKTEAVEVGQVAYGTTTAANEGYQFLWWEDEDGNEVSQESHFVPNEVTRDITYTAVFDFAEEPTEETEPVEGISEASKFTDEPVTIYLYLKVDSVSGGLTINGKNFHKNNDGWYTVGCVTVPGDAIPSPTASNRYDTYSIDAILGYISYENVQWFGTNANLSQAIFSQINWFSLKVEDGATDYYNAGAGSGTHAWHLDGSASITKSILTLRANSESYTYDGIEHSVSGVVTDTFNVNGDTITISGYTTSDPAAIDAGTYENAISGTYTVTSSKYGDVTNLYSITTINGTLTIDKAKVTLTGASDTVTYDKNEHILDQFEVSGLMEGHNFSNVTYTASGLDAGTYEGRFNGTLVVTDNAGNDVSKNYEVAEEPGVLTISPISEVVTVTVVGYTASYKYDGQTHEVSDCDVSIDNALYTINDFICHQEAKAMGVDVGVYGMGLEAAAFENLNNNFTNVIFEVTDGSLEITPIAHITVTKRAINTPANGSTFVFGETINYSITVVNDGMVTLNNIEVADELTGQNWTIIQLGPGTATTFSASYTFDAADMKNGTVTNTATVTAAQRDDDSTPLSPDEITPGSDTQDIYYKLVIYYREINSGDYLAAEHVSVHKYGDAFEVESPEVEGYLPQYTSVRSPEEGITGNWELAVWYSKVSEPTIPVETTEPTEETTKPTQEPIEEPTTPTEETTEPTQETTTEPTAMTEETAEPAKEETAATEVESTTEPSEAAPVIPRSRVAIVDTTDPENVTLVPIEEVESPLAATGIHRCNVLPFLLVTLAAIMTWIGRRKSKKLLKDIMELG